MEKERKVTIGQKLGSTIFGCLCGCGAGTLVTGILGTIVNATSCGRFMKFLMRAGTWGIGLTVSKTVSDAVTDTSEEMFSLLNQVRHRNLPEPTEMEMTPNENMTT